MCNRNRVDPLLDDIRTLREEFEERAAIMEFDGGLNRDEAEAQAWRIVMRPLSEVEKEQARCLIEEHRIPGTKRFRVWALLRIPLVKAYWIEGAVRVGREIS